MQLLYWSTREMQSAAGFLAVEKSMHSSRLAFSSLHTQQGLGLEALSDFAGDATGAEAKEKVAGLASMVLVGRRAMECVW